MSSSNNQNQNQNQNQSQNQNRTILGSTPANQQPRHPITSTHQSVFGPTPIALLPDDHATRNSFLNAIGYGHTPTRSYSKLSKQELTDQIIHLQDFIRKQNAALTREREISDGTTGREGEALESLRAREAAVRAKEVEVKGREEVLEWGFEQVEGVLREAAGKGVELARGVLETRFLEAKGKGRGV